MTVVGIDPGPQFSAYVLFDGSRALRCGELENEHLLDRIGLLSAEMLAVEQVVSYGRPVGADVFETVFWSGRFIEHWEVLRHLPWIRIPFRDVGRHLCNAASGIKESHVRQALIDRFGPSRLTAIGVKKLPGPLYGVSGHNWSALAVAVTAHDQSLTLL